jgi:hypothetical protein
MSYFEALLAPPFTMQDSPPDLLIIMLVAFIGVSLVFGKSFTDRRFLQWGLGRQILSCVLFLFLILAFAGSRLDFIYFVF